MKQKNLKFRGMLKGTKKDSDLKTLLTTWLAKSLEWKETIASLISLAFHVILAL